MKYYLIAGEASGDLHGSNLMKALKKNDPDAAFRFYGGNLMQSIGGELIKHYKEMAYMGLDVILHLPAILKNMDNCKTDLLAWKPDVLILIDYPGFNMRIAEFAHQNKIKVFYYIAPKVWAWKEGRVKQLRKFVDKLFVIFPFEVEYFRKHGIEPAYFGNPLNDSIEDFRQQNIDFETFTQQNLLDPKPIIALVAGSRLGEVTRILPDMMKALDNQSGYQLVVAGAPAIPHDVYNKIIQDQNVKVVYNQTYSLIANASLAVVTSGTATLETALLKTPQVVVFKTNFLAFLIGRAVVKLKYFSLVNLIMKKMVVKEYLQLRLVKQMRDEVNTIINNESYRHQMMTNYNTIEKMLGEPGVADRIANKMIQLLKKTN
jgi:lipid-A-disaccharide synthase